MRHTTLSIVALTLAAAACSSDDSKSQSAGPATTNESNQPAAGAAKMSFFVTSRGAGNGGNFGGLDGADAFCRSLASAASATLGDQTWRAYLSTSSVSARDRIGKGPWYNQAGVLVANDVQQLHDQGMGGSLDGTWANGDANIALDETGKTVPASMADGVFHDILTGSNLDGTVSSAGTCSDWTSTTGTTQNGHSNRGGGGMNPNSWNSAHGTGCGEPDAGMNFQMGTVSQGGGRGSIYCFVAN